MRKSRIFEFLAFFVINHEKCILSNHGENRIKSPFSINHFLQTIQGKTRKKSQEMTILAFCKRKIVKKQHFLQFTVGFFLQKIAYRRVSYKSH